mgnify:FL=1
MQYSLNIVLYQPEIPPNTGNVIRLAANMGARLHLIHPLGFQMGEKALRRAGLDYHDLAQVCEHADYDAFIAAENPLRLFGISTHGRSPYHQVHYQAGDYIMFGPETRGLPSELRDNLPAGHLLRIPMQSASRSLNLSNAVAIVAYEAWRQMGFGSGV